MSLSKLSSLLVKVVLGNVVDAHAYLVSKIVFKARPSQGGEVVIELGILTTVKGIVID